MNDQRALDPSELSPEEVAEIEAVVVPPATGVLGAHVVLLGSHMVLTLFDEHCVNHDFTQAHPDLVAAAEKASEAIAEFYQLVGDRRHRTYD